MIIENNKKQGFTLIEIAIYVSLVGVVLLGLVYFLIGVSQARAKATAISEVQASQRLVFTQLRGLIKSSTNIGWSMSMLNNHPGVLVLLSETGQVTSIKIDTEGYLIVDKAGQISRLTNNLIKVNQLIFRRIDDRSVGIDLGLNYWPQGVNTSFDYNAVWHSTIRLMN